MSGTIFPDRDTIEILIKVLLVQRAYNPGKGIWTIPGGYVDQQERIGDAVCREIAEETGIKTEAVSVIAVRDRPGVRHDVYVVYLLKNLGSPLHGLNKDLHDSPADHTILLSHVMGKINRNDHRQTGG